MLQEDAWTGGDKMSLPTCPSCEYAKGICKKTGVEIRAASGCTYHTPRRISNADKYFRLASDYDIALFLAQVLDNCVIFGANGNCPDSCPMYRCCYDQKGDSIQEWLQEEAEL